MFKYYESKKKILIKYQKIKFVKYQVKFIICHTDMYYMKREIQRKLELYLTLPVLRMDLPSVNINILVQIY